MKIEVNLWMKGPNDVRVECPDKDKIAYAFNLTDTAEVEAGEIIKAMCWKLESLINSSHVF